MERKQKMDVNGSALETTLNEIRTAYPGVSNLLVLNANNQVIAKDHTADDELVTQVSASFKKLSKRAAVVGGIDALTFKGACQSIFFSRHESIYLATITTSQVNQKEITRLTNILFPSTIKVLQEVVSLKEEKKENPKIIEQPKPKIPDPPAQTSPTKLTAPTIPAVIQTPKTDLPKPIPTPIIKPANVIVPEARFKVENISGFSLVSASIDSVWLDRALIGEWRERYGANSIEEVIVSNVETKKTVRCKFEAIKNSKFDGLGIIQVSNRVQASLGAKKGSTVIVKPVIK
jgi:hypothetical protein